MTLSIKPMNPEELWFMCSDNQVLFQVSLVIPWTSTHTMEQVLVFMSNGYPYCTKMDRSTSMTTHQYAWIYRRQKG